jgi:Mg-chelatase subunit ChlI
MTRLRGNSYEVFAISAYKAYSASTGNKNFRGEPMPEWEALPQPIRTAWEAASRQVIEAWEAEGDYTKFPDEQRWNGWVPPRQRRADQNANSTGNGN